MFPMMWFWEWGMFGSWMWLFGAYWLISLVLIIWALIDLAGADKDAGYKLIWAVIAIFLGLIGVLLYYLLEKSPTKESQRGIKR